MTTETIEAATPDLETSLPGGTAMDDALTDIASSMGVEEEKEPAQSGATDESEGATDESSAGDADTAGARPAGKEEAASGVDDKAADPNDRPPDTWRKEAAAEWSQASPVLKAEIAKRENDIRQYVEGIKPHVDVARELEKVMAPLAPVYQKAGVNPWEIMPKMMNAYALLQWGKPEDKVLLFQAMAKDIGLDINQLAQGAANPIDANVQALKNEIQELKSGVRSVTSGWQQQQQAKLTAEVEVFANDPKNAHFYDVADDISRLLKSGVSKTLQDAYERAVWTNPVTRSKAIADQQKAINAEAARKATARTTKAKAASAVNVTARNAGGRAAAKEETIDDTLANTLAAIRAR